MMNAEQSRALDYLERCKADYRKALAARDAIESCISSEWRVAHELCKARCASLDNAYAHVYECKAAPRPYWSK